MGQLRKDHSRLPLSYVDAVAEAGGFPRVLSTFSLLPDEPPPPGLEVLSDLDPDDPSVLDGATGLLLPGGGDIDPEWYGQPLHPKTIRISHRRDRFEYTLLTAALERDMPILAICHGMQLLNVFLGGTLTQHLADRPGTVEHDLGMPRSEAAHELRIKDKSLLADLLPAGATGVNSHHHQGIERVALGLEEVAWAEDGVLEAVASRRHTWVMGVQWHPEAMASGDAGQAALFGAFVDAADAFERRALARLVARS